MEVVRAAWKRKILEVVEDTDRLVDCVHTGSGLVFWWSRAEPRIVRKEIPK